MSKNPRVYPQLALGIPYLIWPGNAWESCRKGCKALLERGRDTVCSSQGGGSISSSSGLSACQNVLGQDTEFLYMPSNVSSAA